MSIQLITSPEDMQAMVMQWHREGLTIGFVPTMGNLHEGHLQLVETAKQKADRVVVSIFVNPLQFGPNEDFAKYPRTLEDDIKRLEVLKVDEVFAPAEESFYRQERERLTYVEVPGLSDILCGATRPGHFRGVTTVVNKLFNIVQPDVAVFGRKDYQQLAIIRQMVEDLAMPVSLVGLETVRESDGLAMSSRNRFLSAEQRALAPKLYQSLQSLRQTLREGEKAYEKLREQTTEWLTEQGFRVDYLEIRDARSLQWPDANTGERVILTAVYLGETRLIDNILV